MKRIFSVLTVVMLSAIMFSSCGQTENPEWQEQLKLGQQYLEELDYENAIAAFNKAGEIDPDRAESYLERAKLYVQREYEGDLVFAAVNYEKAIQLGEETEETFLGLAAAYERLGYVDKALETLQKGCDSTRSSKLSKRLEELEHFSCPKAGSPGTVQNYLLGDNYEVTQYDESGRIIAVAGYNGKDDSALYNHVYTYDEDGNLLKLETLYFQRYRTDTITYSGNSMKRILRHEYSDKQSRTIESYAYNGKKAVMKIVMEDTGYSPLRLTYSYSMEDEDHKVEFGMVQALLGERIEIFNIMEYDSAQNLVKQTRMEYNGISYEEVQI